MIEDAINSLREAQESILSHRVAYMRGSEGGIARGTIGRTVFRTTNEYGSWVRIETRDVIFRKGELALEPQVGDIIIFDGAEYEVLAPQGESVWRWSDPYRTAMRVHTKLVGEEAKG